MFQTSYITKRETQVVNLISLEFTANEIADQMFISYNTVITHKKNIMQKLKVKNTAGLIRRAYELDILQLSVKTLD